MVKSLPVRLCLALAGVVALRAGTVVTNVSVTPMQAILRIRTDQAGSCTVQVSERNNFDSTYAPVHDVDPALFSGANLCNRSGNIQSNGVYTIVIGKRTAEVGLDPRTRYSRALQANTPHYYRVVVGADAVHGMFVTTNIPLGNSHNDPRFDRSRPGEYAYPSINWSDKSAKYIDPWTGAGVRRVSGPGELIPRVTAGQPFSDLLPLGASWTSSGGTASYSGTTRAWLFLRAGTPVNLKKTMSFDAAQLVATLSGTLSSVEVCITNNGTSCSGAIVSQSVTGTATTYTIGTTTPILDSWKDSTSYPATAADVVPSAGGVSKSGASVSWVGGDLFNLKWSSGSRITLGTTDCAISALADEKNLTLASSSCIADGSYPYTAQNWGFLIRAASVNNGALAVSGATWTSSTTAQAGLGSFGAPRICSPVKAVGPGGVLGQVCSATQALDIYTTGNPVYWFGDDGTTNLIGLHYVNVGNSGVANGTCPSSEGLTWDATVPGKYYCIGTRYIDNAPILYSNTYSGTYAATTPDLDQSLGSSIATIESGDLNAQVTAFTSSDAVNYSNFSGVGWSIVARQNNDLILKNTSRNQDSPGWIVVYRPSTKAVIAAVSTYGGASGTANRWGGIHTLAPGGESTWVFGTMNPPDLRYASTITAGTLTSSYSTCPSNTIEPAVAGSAACSAVTLGSLIPTSGGNSLFGQSWLAGDYALVQSNGYDDTELVRIVSLNGSVAVLLRNVHSDVYGLKSNHTGTLGLSVAPSVWKEMWWNYGDDPHGQSLTKAYGATVREDADSINCHEVFELGVYLLGCVKTGTFLGTAVRYGSLPDNFSNRWTSTNQDAGFAGSTYLISPNYNEMHPSHSQYSAPASERPYWFDARPYLGDPQIATADKLSHPSAYIWKLAASATASMQYRKQGFIALNGTVPLVDVSPAVLSNATVDNYKFCYVVNTGDCYTGSLPGEVYFNVPFATVPYVYSTRFAGLPTTIRDLSLTQNTFTVQSLTQASAHRQDAYGSTVRRLTSAFAPYKVQSVFWNFRALPFGDRIFWSTTQLDAIRDELLVADLPPYPAEQSTNRGNFVPVTLNLGGNNGDQVRVRFGYAENGPATNLFCHERQLACATDASGIQPFLWMDEAQQWKTCSNGCTLVTPAISGRVLYYVVDRQNGGVIVTSPLQAIAVP